MYVNTTLHLLHSEDWNKFLRGGGGYILSMSVLAKIEVQEFVLVCVCVKHQRSLNEMLSLFSCL